MPVVEVSIEDSVAMVTLNRPEKYNAINTELVEALADACSEIVSVGARAVVITGKGRGFCAGADLSSSPDPLSPPSRRLRSRYLPTFLQLASLRMPVIAAINGPTAGAGLSIAGAADIRIASHEAFFVSGFIDVGLAPDTGASFFLQRAMGYSNALAFLTSGDRLSAERAVALGLVNEVLAPEQLLARATGLAAHIAKKPGRGVEFTKSLLRAASSNTLAEQLEAEAQAYDLTAVDEVRLAARAAQAAALANRRSDA